MQSPRYQVWIDRGGTFTDCIGRDPDSGRVRVAKVLSGDRAPIEGIRTLLDLGPDELIPPCDIRMGTTIATNALLERRGTPTGLVVTAGLADLLAIGDQTRPELFALDARRPEVLYDEVLEVDGRVSAEGETLTPLDEAAVRRGLEELRAGGLRSLAVALLHSYRAGSMEQRIGELATDVGFDHVSLSHEVASEMGLVARGGTTVADAYLTPLLRDYVDALQAELPGSRLRLMQSSGGLTDAQRFRGRDAVLSGPAAGVVAAAHVAQEAGAEQVIGLDMGGTSTDVCRWGGEFERVYESEVAGVRIRAPMLALHTVAAGGGSICRFDGRRLTVGPDSAGAEPGPLCYGRPEATELTLTDVGVALGRVRADRFPFALEPERVDAALDAVTSELAAQGDRRGREEVAEGFLHIAVENMAEAIRRVSVARGHDVRDHAMVVFGGAGGQFACRLARRLGIRTVLLHPFAGVLSAFGMGVAPLSWHGEQDAGRRALEAGLPEALGPLLDGLEQQGRAALREDGLEQEALRVTRRVDLRYRGTETALSVDEGDAEQLRARFEDAHRRLFGYVREEHPIEAVTARVEVAGQWAAPELPPPEHADTERRREAMWVEGQWRQVPVVHREQLAPQERLEGPALVLEDTGTIVVEPGFTLQHDARGRVALTASEEADVEATGAPSATEQRDPILLEVFNNLYGSIAEQMGIVLKRTALSTNIRERVDFSCAVFDRDGGLVANAPHIPVHLGAMGESVRSVLDQHRDMRPGDVYATNDPAGGGSHLPDITVITPVHDERSGERIFVVASRGHHADVGGTTPGSMPPFSRALGEEGVVLRGLRVVREGRFDAEGLRAALTGAEHPARRPDDNVADMEAQIAANRKGVELLGELVGRYGLATVQAYMKHVQDNAAEAVSDAIAELPDGEHRFEDALDDGTPVCVTLRVDGRQLEVDFEGTGGEHEGNLNAPRAVTLAAVLYVLRTLVGRPIPLNSGCLRSVKLHIPEGSLLSPGPERAVAGGNVETSQRVVDVLLGAVGRVAASQGTMNNLSFGDERFGYYETIAGGAGAGEGFDGASGMHTHMTNSRITDPEVLEARFPVRLRRFGLRRGSGGAGRWRGGDGVVREIEPLAPLRVSILSERRTRPPYGLAGGRPGAVGRNVLGGREVEAKVAVEVQPGETIRIETPGGGGYGAPEGGEAEGPG